MAVALPSGPTFEGDITANLPTLTFECALTDDEKKLLYLRNRAHALTVTACAQATYFVSVFNEARQIKADLSCNAKQRRAMRLLQEGLKKDPTLIGIIGGGRLGCHIAHCLLSYGEVQPEELKISTRRPETLGELQEKGVKCYFDNAAVASSCHLLFLCVLPSQLQDVLEGIKGLVSTRCIVYSLVTGVQLTKLKQVLKCDSIIKPEFEFSMDNIYKPWDISVDVSQAFAVPDMVEKTCPLSLHKNESVVTTHEKFAEIIMYAFLNLCTSLHLPKKETLDVVHAVLFGQTTLDGLTSKISAEDLIPIEKDDSEYFPRYNLIELSAIETPLLKKILTESQLREAFVNRYCNVFEQYLQWKKYNEGF